MALKETPWLARLLLMLALFLPAACSSLPEPPRLSDDEVLQQPSYRIVPRDTIGVFVWRSPELSVSVPVRPDGKISLPLANELQAAGKTPIELALAVEKALKPFVQVPKVSVVVQEFAENDAQTVQVLGEVNDPKSVPYRPYITALDLIVAAGGLTEFADGDRSKLIRRDDKGGRTYGIRIDELIVDGNLKKNRKLRPGDLIVVPSSLL